MKQPPEVEARAHFPEWTQAPGKVAIVHDWLTGMRGGEAILDSICQLFPRADLFTLLQTDYRMSPAILEGRQVITSDLQRLLWLPGMARSYRRLLPLMPWAIERLDLQKYDLVISNTHCVAKGVRVRDSAVHLAYVSTPMRYIWDLFDDYFGKGRVDRLTGWAARFVRPYLQRWDRRTADGIDRIAANSQFVRWRCAEFWGREDAEVIHPFVDLSRFPSTPLPEAELGDYYLVVSAFAPYKRLDLAIAACEKMGRRLLIVGKGQDEERLRGLAGKYTEFRGSLSNAEIVSLYQHARALIFPGLEDFGITPLESMAAGRPVIAYGRGGLLDTVTAQTGVFFAEQNLHSLMGAIEKFESTRFDPMEVRARALAFSREAFVAKFAAFVAKGLSAGPVRHGRANRA